MLHLSNQRLYARENHIPKPSPRSRRTRCPISYLGFGFSIFSPRSPVSLLPASHTPLRHAISPVPRLISDHRRSFVRSVMGVPLLSGRKHARKRAGKKSSPLVSVRSLSLHLHSTLLFFDCPIQVFGLGSISLSMQSPLPALRSNVPLRSFRDLSCHSEPVN